LSFFDDDEPRPSRAQRPRPAAASSRRGSSRSGDPEAIRRRQLVAAGVLLLFFVILIFGVKACSSSARKRNLREYNDAVGAIVQKSDRQVATPLFGLLSSASTTSAGKSVQLQNQINALKLQAEKQVDQASALDVPDEAVGAQRFVLLALELRRDGMGVIAQQIQPALSGTDNGSAARRIAGEMRAFDASDVIWSQRAIPAIRDALKSNGVTVGGRSGERVASSVFLRDGAWLDPTYVADKLGSGGGASASGKPTPGRHGHALISTSVGATTLSTSATNQVPVSPLPVFKAQVQNQGDNDERDVRVRVTVGDIVTTKVVPRTTKGGNSTVSVTLRRKPPTGSVQTVKVSVLPVPGEQTTDNNTQSYPVLFSG
jgi:hypothetical protein